MPRYVTSGIPPEQAALAGSAFMPFFTRMAASGAETYKTLLPGSGPARRHAAPTIDTVPSPDLGDMVLMGTSRSSDAPDAWYINDYDTIPDRVWDTTGGTARVQVYNPVAPELTTMIPVPAVDLRSLYQARSAALAGGVRSNRDKALHQATAFAKWPKARRGNGLPPQRSAGRGG